MGFYVTLRVKRIAEAYNEEELIEVIRDYGRACVALREDGKFKLFGHVADGNDTEIERHIYYDHNELIETDNLRLAIYTLYRPFTALLVERNAPIGIVRYGTEIIPTGSDAP